MILFLILFTLLFYYSTIYYLAHRLLLPRDRCIVLPFILAIYLILTPFSKFRAKIVSKPSDFLDPTPDTNSGV